MSPVKDVAVCCKCTLWLRSNRLSFPASVLSSHTIIYSQRILISGDLSYLYYYSVREVKARSMIERLAFLYKGRRAVRTTLDSDNLQRNRHFRIYQLQAMSGGAVIEEIGSPRDWSVVSNDESRLISKAGWPNFGSGFHRLEDRNDFPTSICGPASTVATTSLPVALQLSPLSQYLLTLIAPEVRQLWIT